jgi:hypothetical protein
MNDRIVSVKVEWEEESILILFVITSSRVPGDTSEAPTPSPCLLYLHQRHGRSAVVNSTVDTRISPFVAIGSPIQQFERYHRFLSGFGPWQKTGSFTHATGNDIKDKFLILSWCHFWAPFSYLRLAWLRLNLRICYISRHGLLIDWLNCRILKFFICLC